MKSLTSALHKSGHIIRCRSNPNDVSERLCNLLKQDPYVLKHRDTLIIKFEYYKDQYFSPYPCELIYTQLGYSVETGYAISKKLPRMLKRYGIYTKLILVNYTSMLDSNLFVKEVNCVKNHCLLIDSKQNIDEYLNTKGKIINFPIIDI